MTKPLCNRALKVPHDSSSNWGEWWQGREWLRASYVAGRLWCAQNDIITTAALISVQSRSCNPEDHRRHTVLSYPHATFSPSTRWTQKKRLWSCSSNHNAAAGARRLQEVYFWQHLNVLKRDRAGGYHLFTRWKHPRKSYMESGKGQLHNNYRATTTVWLVTLISVEWNIKTWTMFPQIWRQYGMKCFCFRLHLSLQKVSSLTLGFYT